MTPFPLIALGVRNSFGEDATLRYDMLAAFARWAAEGRLAVPIARTFALDDWGLARDISQGGQARGKLVLLPGGLAGGDERSVIKNILML